MTAAASRRLHLSVNAWLQAFVRLAWRESRNNPLGFVDVQHCVPGRLASFERLSLAWPHRPGGWSTAAAVPALCAPHPPL